MFLLFTFTAVIYRNFEYIHMYVYIFATNGQWVFRRRRRRRRRSFQKYLHTYVCMYVCKYVTNVFE